MWLLAPLLRRIVRRGVLTVTDADGRRHVFGAPHRGFPEVAIRFADRKTPFAIARNPRLGFGEAWMEGRIRIDAGDLPGLLTLIRGNAPWERGGRALKPKGALRRGVGRVAGFVDRLNWEARSRRNVAHHYDLNDRLYDLFLDADRQYSCAYFSDPAASLDDAQAAKKAHIAAKLHLRPGLRVLDIGCGWGGMALYLNRVADVEVLGVTLSEEQLKVARDRARAAGVQDRVRFERVDYRRVKGRFDRIVSVGMFEHVGPRHYREFFFKTRDLLAEDGVMLLHTIGRMGAPGTTDPFTAKYIFPGGYNPALSEIVTASQAARMIVTDIEVLRLHYALTLDRWYRRTMAAQEAITAMYDARFFRLWQFYLAGAASAFRFGGLVNYQLQYVRNRHALPITRDYMQEVEAALKTA